MIMLSVQLQTGLFVAQLMAMQNWVHHDSLKLEQRSVTPFTNMVWL